MAKEDAIQLEGAVTEVLPNATFRVQLTNGHNVLATLGGNMRRFRIARGLSQTELGNAVGVICRDICRGAGI